MSSEENKHSVPVYCEILELLARLGGYKGIDYEIAELKDGRPHKLKNIKIAEIDLTKKP